MYTLPFLSLLPLASMIDFELTKSGYDSLPLGRQEMISSLVEQEFGIIYMGASK